MQLVPITVGLGPDQTSYG